MTSAGLCLPQTTPRSGSEGDEQQESPRPRCRASPRRSTRSVREAPLEAGDGRMRPVGWVGQVTEEPRTCRKYSEASLWHRLQWIGQTVYYRG